MCLSTVYKVNGGEPELFCKNVQNVMQDPDSGEIRFTDIMGMQHVLVGKILSIDLVKNTIDVREC